MNTIGTLSQRRRPGRFMRWLMHLLWRLGFPRFKTPLACHTCGHLSKSEREHLTHGPCERPGGAALTDEAAPTMQIMHRYEVRNGDGVPVLECVTERQARSAARIMRNTPGALMRHAHVFDRAEQRIIGTGSA